MQTQNTYEKIKNETFTIQKAIQRISWRFKNENVKINESKITINELDIKAVEEIEKYIKKTENKTFENNEAFAKLFAYSLKQEILYFNDVKVAVKTLSEKLKLPLEYHFDEIVFLCNQIEIEKEREKTGISNKSIFLMTDDELKKLKHELKTNKTVQNKILGFWKHEDIYKSLKNTINSILTDF